MDWKINSHDTVSSTQDIARELGRGGAPEGTVVTADRQTAGRGRRGNIWHSSSETGLWMSCILRPETNHPRLPGLSLLVAVASASAVEECSAAEVTIKWPNDLFVRGRKLGGILCEAETTAPGEKGFVAAGIGINLCEPPGGFPDAIASTATSIRRETGRSIGSHELLVILLRCIGSRYEQFCRGDLSPVLEEYSRRDFLRGRTVTLGCGDRLVRGIAVGVGEHGGILLKKEREEPQEFITCEVVEWAEGYDDVSDNFYEGG